VACLDPDPLTHLNPDPDPTHWTKCIQNGVSHPHSFQYESGSCTAVPDPDPHLGSYVRAMIPTAHSSKGSDLYGI
jgi:hypothetical protein